MKGRTLDDDALVLSEDDTVATALADLPAGRTFESGDRSIVLTDDVPFGHTFALEAIPDGEAVLKYGEVIGRATSDIAAGDWVHTHNLESTRGRGDQVAEGEAP